MHIKDAKSGVDQDSIVMRVFSDVVTPVITGDRSDYTLTYDPPYNFNYNQTVVVFVSAYDLAGNYFSEEYTFKTVAA